MNLKQFIRPLPPNAPPQAEEVALAIAVAVIIWIFVFV